MFQHKQYGVSIKIGKSKFLDEFQEALDASKKCLEHGMAAVIRGDYSRRYRRGKNRCGRCGVKLIKAVE